MKKQITTFLAAAMSFSLFACSSSNKGGNADSSAKTSDSSSESKEETTDKKSEKMEVVFEGQPIVDNDEVAWKITDIDLNSWTGMELTVDLENKSSETTYMFSIEDVSVNGLEVPSLYAEEVAPGKKAHSDATILTSDAKDAGIKNITDIEVTYRVYDTNDWSADAVASGSVHIYPYGEDKAEKYTRDSQSSDIVLFDNEYLTVLVTNFDKDGLMGYDVNLYLVNKTEDTTLMFSIDETSVNDYMVDPFWATTVKPGHSKFNSMTFYTSSLQDCGIETVEKIEGTFRIYDYDSWGSDYVDEVIVLKP